MADEPKLYGKEGYPDRLFTDAQYANLGEGADGWIRKNKPVTPPELKGKPAAKDAATATGVAGQTAQTPANNGD